MLIDNNNKELGRAPLTKMHKELGRSDPNKDANKDEFG